MTLFYFLCKQWNYIKKSFFYFFSFIVSSKYCFSNSIRKLYFQRYSGRGIPSPRFESHHVSTSFRNMHTYTRLQYHLTLRSLLFRFKPQRPIRSIASKIFEITSWLIVFINWKVYRFEKNCLFCNLSR